MVSWKWKLVLTPGPLFPPSFLMFEDTDKLFWRNPILEQLKLYNLMAKGPDPTLFHLSPGLGIFPFNHISKEVKQHPVKGFLPKENLKA